MSKKERPIPYKVGDKVQVTACVKDSIWYRGPFRAVGATFTIENIRRSRYKGYWAVEVVDTVFAEEGPCCLRYDFFLGVKLRKI